MFRSTDGGQAWQKINKGLSALYESCLAINAAGDIFPGADFVNCAGGVFRSTDNGQSRVEINHDVIQTDVRALAINSNGHIFAGTYFGGGVFRSTDNGSSSMPVNNGLACGTSGRWRCIRPARFLLELQAAKRAFTVPLTMATARRLLR